MDLKLKQFVSYAGHGIGQITEIKTMHETEFYSIDIIGTGLKILIPKAQPKALIRPLMDPATAKTCRMYIEAPNAVYTPDRNQTWKRRFDAMMKKITSNNPIQLAEVVAELTIRKTNGEQLSFGERKMFDAAHLLLQTEIDLVLK